MKIYDISQEIFSCEVYSGDRAPRKICDMRMSSGGLYNLTSFEMCAHNGTHLDAPYHFIEDGETVENIPLERVVGECYVTEENEDICAERAAEILRVAEAKSKEAAKRILTKGKGTVSEGAAQAFADRGIYLVGVESQTVGPEDAPMQVHKILLGKKIVLLEGTRLSDVPEGVYFLCAAPLSLEGSDGAPCRAILIEK